MNNVICTAIMIRMSNDALIRRFNKERIKYEHYKSYVHLNNIYGVHCNFILKYIIERINKNEYGAF